MTTLPTNLLGRTAGVSLGTGGTYTLDPTAGVTGAALATGDFLFAAFGAQDNSARKPIPGSGWTEIRPYAALGTMSWGLWVRERGEGETTYTGTLSTEDGTGGTSVRMWWGSGHDVIANWIIGAVFTRSGSSALNVPASITTTQGNTLGVVVSSERTIATEVDADISIDNGFSKDYFDVTGTDVSLLVAHKDMVTTGATGTTTVTYPNAHGSNGIAVQIGIPPVPDTGPTEGSATGTISWSGAATGEAPTVADASGSATGTITWASSATGAHTAAGAAVGTLTWEGVATGPATPVEMWIADQPYYIAHRGRSAPGLQPEETLVAYASAVAWGVKALEVSVWPSSDGVWVCSHDPTTGRVFSGPSLTIASETWATLSAKTSITGGHPIARLEEVLDLYAGTHIIIIEDKPAGSYPAFYAVLDDYPNSTGRFIIKAYMNSGVQSSEARTRGYRTWGYFYDDDVDTDLATKVARWDYMTLNYNATEVRWDALLAFGKPVAAHVCIDAADATEGFSKGAVGIMAADFEDIIPFDGTAEGSASGTLTLTGTATGSAEHEGSATGAIGWTGSATGTATHQGEASGSIAWTGVATGATSNSGDASGAIAWTGTATGQTPLLVESGSASGSVTWSAVATGARSSSGGALGTMLWAGTATGAHQAYGLAGGLVAWAGSAAGVAPGQYTPAGHTTAQTITRTATAVTIPHTSTATTEAP